MSLWGWVAVSSFAVFLLWGTVQEIVLWRRGRRAKDGHTDREW